MFGTIKSDLIGVNGKVAKGTPPPADYSKKADQINTCFGPLLDLHIWSGHIGKAPNAGTGSNYSINSPLLWHPLFEVLETQRGTAGVCLNLTGGVRHADPDTGGVYRLVGIDVDKVTGPIELLDQLKTYVEFSFSGKGRRAFCWVPEAFARQYRDKPWFALPNCHHAEIYLGSGGRLLTVTFEPDGEARPIAVLDEARQGLLAALLNKADAPGDTLSLPPAVPGTRIDLTQCRLTPDHQRLIDFVGKIDDFDRSPVVRKLLLHLIDKCNKNREDLLATMLQEPALWEYCLYHRNYDEDKAFKFAEYEIDEAWKKSRTGKTEIVSKLFAKTDLIGPVNTDAPQGQPVNTDAPQTEPPFKRKPISQLLKEIKPYVWLIEGILPKGFLIALLGQPNSGKTAITLDMALRTAMGMKLGQRRTLRTRVIYIAAENPEEVKLRIKLWCGQNDVKPEELDDCFFLVEESVFFDDEAQAKAFHDEWAAMPPGLIAIDTFSANYDGESENSATEVMRWFNHVRKYLIQPFGCAVLVLHHPPKNSDNPFEWRGSGSAKATIDNFWAAINSRGVITMPHDKLRSTPFDPLYWRYFTAQVGEQKDNFNNPTRSVIAVPTDKIIETGRNQDLMKICAAIGSGITVHRRLAELSGHCKTDIGKILDRMKTSNNDHGRLLSERTGVLYLTAEGKEWAEEGRILLGGQLDAPAEKGGGI